LELGLDASIGRSEHFPAGHDDHINCAFRLVMAKQLAGEPFGPVALDRCSHLPRGGNAKARHSSLAIPREHRHEAARTLETSLVDEFEVRALPNVLGW
jgi:hypothetical protein